MTELDAEVAKKPARKVGFLLGLGIFLAPLIFVWFLIRPGYSVAARAWSIAWTCWVALILFAGIMASMDPEFQAQQAQQAAKAAEEKPAPEVEEPQLPTFTKDLWVKAGGAICASEDEITAYYSGAPARCRLAPAGLRAYYLDTVGGAFSSTLKVRVRFPDDSTADLYVSVYALTNDPPEPAASP